MSPLEVMQAHPEQTPPARGEISQQARSGLTDLVHEIQGIHLRIAQNPNNQDLALLRQRYQELERGRAEVARLTPAQLAELKRSIPPALQSNSLPNSDTTLTGLMAQIMQQERDAGPILQPLEENASHSGLITSGIAGFATFGPVGALAAPAYLGITTAIDNYIKSPTARAITKTTLGAAAVITAGLTGGWIPALSAVGLGALTSYAFRKLQEQRAQQSQSEFRAALAGA